MNPMIETYSKPEPAVITKDSVHKALKHLHDHEHSIWQVLYNCTPNELMGADWVREHNQRENECSGSPGYTIAGNLPLSSPGFKGTFSVSRDLSTHGSLFVKITHAPMKHIGIEPVTFSVFDPSEVLAKVKIVLSGLRNKSLGGRACCRYASVRNCICDISFSCPLHGSECHGSHD